MTDWVAVEPLIDEPEQRAYWPPFKVGDRVRLLTNGECPLHSDLSVALAGQLGTIEGIDDDENAHNYRVRIDRVDLLPAPWMADFGPCCAVNEMEPV